VQAFWGEVEAEGGGQDRGDLDDLERYHEEKRRQRSDQRARTGTAG
jgi:hypothetical protein